MRTILILVTLALVGCGAAHPLSSVPPDKSPEVLLPPVSISVVCLPEWYSVIGHVNIPLAPDSGWVWAVVTTREMSIDFEPVPLINPYDYSWNVATCPKTAEVYVTYWLTGVRADLAAYWP